MAEHLAAYGPWGLALAAFCAGSVVPFPAEAVLAALVALGRSPAAMTAVATAANVLGATTLLLAGRWGRDYALRRVGAERLGRAQERLTRFGPWPLLASWLPIVGDAFVVAAGIARLPWSVCLPLIALGKGARYALVAYGALWLR